MIAAAETPAGASPLLEWAKQSVPTVIGLVIIGGAGWLAAVFLASKLLAGAQGTWKNVFRYVAYLLAVGLALASIQFFFHRLGVGLKSEAPASIGRVLIVIAGIVASFLVPKAVFGLGGFQTFLFWLLVGVLNTLCFAIGSFAIPAKGGTIGVNGLRTYLAAKRGEPDAVARMDATLGKLGIRVGNPSATKPKPKASAPTLADREARLQQMYQELVEERNRLDPNDRAGVEAFNARNARYQMELAEVKAMRPAPAVPAAPGTPASPSPSPAGRR